MVAINNALMVDLTGQACAESLGFKQYSGTGVQLDFVRGVAMAKNGQSFISESISPCCLPFAHSPKPMMTFSGIAARKR